MCSIQIHTHSELCPTLYCVPHHLSDCSYLTGITLMASCLGTLKTKGVLKSWNERVCHYLGIQRAEEAVSVLQTVDVSSVEAHCGLTGSLRMASLWRARLHWNQVLSVWISHREASCPAFQQHSELLLFWLLILTGHFDLSSEDLSSTVPGVYTGKSRTPAMIRQTRPSPKPANSFFPYRGLLEEQKQGLFFFFFQGTSLISQQSPLSPSP